MGQIVAVRTATGAGTVIATIISSGTAVNNNGALSATNASTLTTTVTSYNSALDLEFVILDSSGTTEYTFTNTVNNHTTKYWHKYLVSLGFQTGASFVASSTTDLLDFDTSGTLGDPDNFAPLPTHTFPPEGSSPVATEWGSNDLAYGATPGGSGNRIAATALNGVHTLTFTIDVPDYLGADMPSAVQFSGGYTFTLRQYAYATAAGGQAGSAAYGWIG